ncbi:hypothetical protein LB507_010947, partial [Fusarium sp. FIESC RH6]
NLRLLAIGLAGLDIAVGSPCKPISSVSDSSIATTSTTSGSSSFTLSLETSATVATTTTEIVTLADTTTEATTVTEVGTATTEATTSGDVTSEATNFATSVATTEATTGETTVTEIVTASTEAATSGGMTSEVTTFATSVATTEETSATSVDTTTETTATSDAVTTSAEITEAPTTTEEATTTAAPTTTTVPMFRLVAESGTYANQAIAVTRYQGTKLSFYSISGYAEAFFTVDTTTGRLLLDGKTPICGMTPGDGTSALQVCSDNMSSQERFIICEAPTSRQLECTVPELFCSMMSGCAATGNLWGTTYIEASGGTGVDTLFLGPENKQGETAVPLLIVHSSD